MQFLGDIVRKNAKSACIDRVVTAEAAGPHQQ